MFNLFSKSKKKAREAGAAKAHKKFVDTKTASKKAKKKQQKNTGPSSELPPTTPDQTLHQAAEQLEAARRQLDNSSTADVKPPPQDREDLIKRALAIQKAQSRLLDNLDEDTRRRLKALAMEAMAIKPGQTDN